MTDDKLYPILLSHYQAQKTHYKTAIEKADWMNALLHSYGIALINIILDQAQKQKEE